MSTSPESESNKPEFELDMDLHFLPAWAQKAPDTNRYSKYKGDEETSSGRGRGGSDRPRGPRRDGPPSRGPRPDGRGPGGPGGGGGGRPGFGGGGGRPSFGGDRRGGPPGRGQGRDMRDDRPREPQIPLPNLDVNFIPEDKGVESLARQIKLTGRAYPLFEIAGLVLKKPERYNVELRTKKADGKSLQPMFICGLDDTLWLSEKEVVDYVFQKHFGTFYTSEKIPTDAPKGTYTFVAQCGMSGAILGPPNYHDYQTKLRRLHTERFARVPFEMFKSRIKIVKDEVVVKKWLEDQSFRTEYTGINIPEPVKLSSMEEVERHFREVHFPVVVREIDTHILSGPAAINLPNRPLQTLVRRLWEEQSRFPLKIVNILSQQFAKLGLQFFKVNKTITHVAVARPHFLDMIATPVSPGVKSIVDFINNTPKATRKKLIEAFAPAAPAATPAPAPAPEAPAAAAAPAEAAPVDAAAAPEAPKPAPAPATDVPPTPELGALISNLHWLIHQGHVIEFANGLLETAKRPLPKPVREKPAAPAKAAPAPEAAAAANESTPAIESVGAGSEPSESAGTVNPPLSATNIAAEAGQESPAAITLSESPDDKAAS